MRFIKRILQKSILVRWQPNEKSIFQQVMVVQKMVA